MFRWNNLEPGSGYSLTPTFTIPRRYDAVLRAPKQQCWDVDPVQPSSEPRIVHVGLPAVERECLTSADDRCQLALRQFGEIDVALRRVCPGHPQIIGPRQPMHVGNIALLSAGAPLGAHSLSRSASSRDQPKISCPRRRSNNSLRSSQATYWPRPLVGVEDSVGYARIFAARISWAPLLRSSPAALESEAHGPEWLV